MLLVRHILYEVSHFLAHSVGQGNAIVLFQDIVHAAFSRLAVDADHIGIVIPTHILGIDRQIRYCPLVGSFLLTPLHPFCDRILMRT